MLRADLQEGDSAAQRQDPAGGGAALVPVQDSDVVRDGDTYYLVINNLGGERDTEPDSDGGGCPAPGAIE